MNRIKLFIPLIIFSVLAIFLLLGLHNDPSKLPSALIGKPLPAFSLPVLGKEGETITNEDLIGEPFLLNVWATWCPSCRVEHPYLLQLQERGVNIIGLNYKDDDAAALVWLEKLNNPYKLNIVDAEGRLGLDLGVYGAPEVYVVDSKGIIQHRNVGVIDDKVWKQTLAPLMQ